MSKRFDKIYDEVIQLLEKKLPKFLTYHTVGHTQYVLKKVIYIADKEKISKKNILLLKIAALFHDIGFTQSNIEHEKKGCKIARRVLFKYNFSQVEIDKICGMIMATRIPQEPKTNLECILADADLEYLATNKFKEIGDTLFTELKHYNKTLTRKKWNSIQIEFMKNHSYHTAYCKRYKTFRKNRNLSSLTK